MRTTVFDHLSVYAPEEVIKPEDQLELVNKFARQALKAFTKKPLVKTILCMHSTDIAKCNFCILEAHGLHRNDEWYFVDGKKAVRLQEWIDSVDGDFLAVILHTCNPGNDEIFSRKSAVIHRTDSFSAQDYRFGDYRLFLPGHGYLDNSRQLRRALDKMCE